MEKSEKAILGVAIFIGAILIMQFLRGNGSFSDSLLPEFIGIVIEVIFITIFMAWLIRRDANNREIKRKSMLKEALRNQLSIFILWSQPLDSEVDPIKSIKNKKALKALINKIRSNKNLDSVAVNFIKIFSIREMAALETLLAVAASIDSDHMNSWASIINNLKGVRDSETDTEAIEATEEFLHQVSFFDDLTVKI